MISMVMCGSEGARASLFEYYRMRSNRAHKSPKPEESKQQQNEDSGILAVCRE